jgi:hypothetical protein
MSRVRFGPTTQVFELEKRVHSLDRTATVIGKYYITVNESRVIRLEVLLARIRITRTYRTLVYIVIVSNHLELLVTDGKVLKFILKRRCWEM